MKKLSTLTLGLLFAAGSAFAQSNDATVDQSGDYNTSTVDQSGNGNETLINQVVDAGVSDPVKFNEATVEQTGSENFADIDQRNRGQHSSRGLFNDADLIQDGTLNYAIIDQAGIGRGNDVKLSQLGIENRAEVSQRQGGRLSGYGSESRAVQSGERNELYLTMGNFNDAGITQDGNDNYADISQLSFSNDYVELKQTGDENEVLLNQSGGTADVQQIGVGGNILNGLAGIGSYASQSGGASMTIVQNGLSNELFVGQNGASTVTVTQSGDMNTGSVDQSGAHSGTLTQTGSLNSGSITQSN
ncbi:hypothetical protein [Rhodohalobacter sp. 8-1]|uniref:hypothetical protein n=1 Tax=Rhodohalobacter sp. 8-1 TaxID=3131972 RepID=UPI0030EE8F68